MTPEQREQERKRRQDEQKRKMEAGPQRIGRKKKKKGADTSSKLPQGKKLENNWDSSAEQLMQTAAFAARAHKGLHHFGARVYIELRTT